VTGSRQAYAHQVDLVLDAGADPAAPGGAVTVALCGSWDHEGACRWPHHNEIDTGPELARLRTIFVADPSEAEQIRGVIEGALRAGQSWRVVATHARPLALDDDDLGRSLLRASGA
jgi:hypothetical protein